MDVTVAIGTFGLIRWERLARRRAIPSAEALGVPVIHVHADTLHDARNGALNQVQTEWVCHLDADDVLESGYFEAMERGTADLRAPAVRYVWPGREANPIWMPQVAGHMHACSADCLTYGNWLVIGTVARTKIVRDAGGWRDFPWSEDYDLWVRCWQIGATIEAIPDAIYRAYANIDSRNRKPDHAARLAAHQAIARANGLPVPA